MSLDKIFKERRVIMGVLLLPMGALVLLSPFIYLLKYINPILRRLLEIRYDVEIDEDGNIIEPQ